MQAGWMPGAFEFRRKQIEILRRFKFFGSSKSSKNSVLKRIRKAEENSEEKLCKQNYTERWLIKSSVVWWRCCELLDEIAWWNSLMKQLGEIVWWNCRWSQDALNLDSHRACRQQSATQTVNSHTELLPLIRLDFVLRCSDCSSHSHSLICLGKAWRIGESAKFD